MNVKVLTYNNPNTWHSRVDYKKITSGIHICATRSMTEGVSSRYSKDGLNSVFYSQTVINALYPKVFSSAIRLQLLLESISLVDDSNLRSEEKAFIRNNAKEILDTIIDLRFVGVYPEAFDGISLAESESVVTKFWKEIVNNCNSYKVIEKDITKFISNRNFFVAELSKVLSCDQTTLFQKELYLVGFYYITPQQQVVLSLMRDFGCNLTFFNLYDARFPETFDFVKKSINSKYGWPDKWEIEDYSGFIQRSNGHSFLSMFSNGDKIAPLSQLTLKRYNTVIQFQSDVLMKGNYDEILDYSCNKNYAIVGTNADILNKVFENYYPNHRGTLRNFLKYPIGQFIINLHSLYGEGEEIELDFEKLCKLFSSGWIFDEKSGENARDYLFRFKMIESHFTGCLKTKQWEDRFDLISEVIKNNKHYFLIPGESEDRAYVSLRSPFARFSFSEIDENELNKIKFFFSVVVDIAKKLFSEGRHSNFKEHFGKLTEMIRVMDKSRQGINDEIERRVVREICEALINVDGQFSFLYKDVSHALSYYLNGSLEREPERIIIPFIEIDGVVMNPDIRQFHITGLDEFGLPFKEFELPWPYTKETLSVLGLSFLPVSLYISRNQSIKCVSRYLMFISLEFTCANTEFSWIENFHDKENLRRSFYTELVEGLFNETIGETIQYNYEEKHTYYLDSPDLKSDFVVHEDFLAEYAYCPRRFLYSYLLSRHSTFSSDFILKNFMFSHLLRVLKYHCNLSDDIAFNEAYHYFPQWNITTLRVIGYESMKRSLSRESRSLYKNLSIPDSRIRFIFPGSKRDMIQEYYSDDAKCEAKNQIPISISMDKFIKSEKTDCKFCPFKDRCDIVRMEG